MIILDTAHVGSFVSTNDGKKYNIFGDTITVKVPGEMTNGAYSISEDVTPPGQAHHPTYIAANFV
jgi:hypothetical protein